MRVRGEGIVLGRERYERCSGEGVWCRQIRKARKHTLEKESPSLSLPELADFQKEKKKKTVARLSAYTTSYNASYRSMLSTGGYVSRRGQAKNACSY